jgi:hypothetical protein
MVATENVTDFTQRRGSPLTDEFQRLTKMIADACPGEAHIQFSFDRVLRVVIDVRTMEDVVQVEMALKQVGAGMFRDVTRGQAPGHSFGRRVMAIVDR